jgi:hypothetical protein
MDTMTVRSQKEGSQVCYIPYMSGSLKEMPRHLEETNPYHGSKTLENILK